MGAAANEILIEGGKQTLSRLAAYIAKMAA
jgi:hypothetical protein